MPVVRDPGRPRLLAHLQIPDPRGERVVEQDRHRPAQGQHQEDEHAPPVVEKAKALAEPARDHDVRGQRQGDQDQDDRPLGQKPEPQRRVEQQVPVPTPHGRRDGPGVGLSSSAGAGSRFSPIPGEFPFRRRQAAYKARVVKKASGPSLPACRSSLTKKPIEVRTRPAETPTAGPPAGGPGRRPGRPSRAPPGRWAGGRSIRRAGRSA